MKILGFGDIHMATDKALQIPGIAEADLVLLTGDLTNYGSVKDAKIVLDNILKVNSNVLAQFGNLDSPEINDYLEELNINLHNQARLIQGEVCIIGVGGSNYTPFNTPSEYSENELYNLADQALRQGKDFIALAEPLHNREIPMIFISHAPPANTLVDRLRNGKHVGSTGIRRAIEQHQPEICITGHIHEAKGQDKLLKTSIYNPGMLGKGGWVEIDITQTKLEVTLQ